MKRLESLKQVREEAEKIRTFQVAFLSPEDTEVMKAIKKAREQELISPILIGKESKIQAAAEKAEFDLGNVPLIHEESRMKIALRGLKMFYEEEVDLVCKGQIPTSYIYKAIISKEKKQKHEFDFRISVFSLWELTSQKRFVLLTDTGVNIRPDWQTKALILRNAVFFMSLLGYQDLKALVLSAFREIEKEMNSKRDAEKIREYFLEEKVPCQIEIGDNLKPYLLGEGKEVPEIVLVPHLDAGNIIVKLDFFLDIARASVVMSSKGPIIVPSRSDTSEHILTEIALGKVVTYLLRKQRGQ